MPRFLDANGQPDPDAIEREIVRQLASYPPNNIAMRREMIGRVVQSMVEHELKLASVHPSVRAIKERLDGLLLKKDELFYSPGNLLYHQPQLRCVEADIQAERARLAALTAGAVA